MCFTESHCRQAAMHQQAGTHAHMQRSAANYAICAVKYHHQQQHKDAVSWDWERTGSQKKARLYAWIRAWSSSIIEFE